MSRTNGFQLYLIEVMRAPEKNMAMATVSLWLSSGSLQLEKQDSLLLCWWVFYWLSAFGKTDLSKKIFAFREMSCLISLYQSISVSSMAAHLLMCCP